MSHHPLTISVINEMLLKTNYGYDLIKYGKSQLN
jgi:hypothetical protein